MGAWKCAQWDAGWADLNDRLVVDDKRRLARHEAVCDEKAVWRSPGGGLDKA